MGGDFNIALHSLLDRYPPRAYNYMAFNLTHFMLKFNLKDIWREKNPGMSSFTWSNKACTSLSRIDFWLISNCLDNNDIKVNILTIPLTDHKAISINISLNNNNNISQRMGSYWKLNSSIL